MTNPDPESFRQLTISVEKLQNSTAQAAANWASQRARLLLGCYRSGEANDPETYVAAIAAMLARYPESVMTAVTHPVTGLPAQLKWLPTVVDVREACERAMLPTRQDEDRKRRLQEQMAAREEHEQDRSDRPTYEQLKAKYGPKFGLGIPDETPAEINARWAKQVKSWDEIKAFYEAHPERWRVLTRPREEGLR